MSTQPAVIADANRGSTPCTYQLPAGTDIELRSVTALWNGGGAGGSFLACLAVYTQDGVLLSRTFPDQQLNVGDTAEVTYLPFSKRRQSAATGSQAGFFDYALSLGPWEYYPLQEPSGLPLDYSGNNWNPSALTGNAVTYRVPGPFSDGTAMRFVAPSYFNGLNATGWPVTDGFSWAAWVSVSAMPSSGSGYGNFFWAEVSLDTHTPNKWSAVRQGVAVLGDSVANVGVSAWTFIALVNPFNTHDFNLYVNGLPDSTIGNGGIPGSGQLFTYIGPTESNGFNCDICNCLSYARVLTDDEVLNLYLGGPP